MAKQCLVCAHPAVATIDEALVAGKECTGLSGLFRLSVDSLRRHRRAHLPAAAVVRREAAEEERAETLVEQAQALHRKTLEALDGADAAGDRAMVLRAVREARRNLELMARLLGEIDDRPQINILWSPEWMRIRDAMLEALDPFPAARLAVAEAMVRLEVTG